MASDQASVEAERAAALRDAEQKALDMFKEIEHSLIRPGVSDKQLSDEIHRLGVDKHGLRTHWHKRIVRSGPNTLRPFDDNPPDREIEEDDILVIDLGPVFQEWEADFGRTFVLGNDPKKLRLQAALEPMWRRIKTIYEEKGDMTGEELYLTARKTAEADGWFWRSRIAGHIVGDFPHERIPKDKITLYIAEGNTQPLKTPGKNGHQKHWILECYLQEPEAEYGGFFEQLLTVE